MGLESIMLWNKSDVKGQEPYDFIPMWDIKQNQQTNKTNTTHKHWQQYGGYQREGEWGEDEEDKGSQIYGDGWRLTLGDQHTM